jgi:hypothetical protein
LRKEDADLLVVGTRVLAGWCWFGKPSCRRLLDDHLRRIAATSIGVHRK